MRGLLRRSRGNTFGMSLIELLVGIVITSIIAGGLLRMVMVDLHFAEDREAWRTARQAARSGLVVLAADVRMLETGGGIEAASSGGQDLTIRAPYAFGVLCSTTGSTSIASLIPVDSAMFAQPGHSGFAWRDDATGSYTYIAAGGVAAGASSCTCNSSGITILPGSQLVTLTGSIPSTLPAGTIVFLYRRVRYEIKSSVVMPGQVALWRTLLTGGASQELGAPFVPTARFRYFVEATPTAQSATPSPLSAMVGLELAFGGRSDRTPRGEAGPKIVPFTTAIYFHNRTP